MEGASQAEARAVAVRVAARVVVLEEVVVRAEERVAAVRATMG